MTDRTIHRDSLCRTPHDKLVGIERPDFAKEVNEIEVSY